MKYITFQENNYKEKESFIFFLQYDENEENLKLLHDYINCADFSSLYGDYSTFEIDLNTLLNENIVEELCKVKLGSFSHRFQICKGNFDFLYENLVNKEECEKARILNELFFSCSIRDYFISSNQLSKSFLEKEKFDKTFEDMIEKSEELLKKVSDINYIANKNELNNIYSIILNFADKLFEREKKVRIVTYLYKIFSQNAFRILPDSHHTITRKKAEEFLKNCNEWLLYDKENMNFLEFKKVLENYLEIIIKKI